ncbi:hypothetical protein H6G64_09855 [Calothrix sp. FACHB-156]|nr:hypothetical protein [Calothrix sp. FACHB-156]
MVQEEGLGIGDGGDEGGEREITNTHYPLPITQLVESFRYTQKWILLGQDEMKAVMAMTSIYSG